MRIALRRAPDDARPRYTINVAFVFGLAVFGEHFHDPNAEASVYQDHLTQSEGQAGLR